MLLYRLLESKVNIICNQGCPISKEDLRNEMLFMKIMKGYNIITLSLQAQVVCYPIQRVLLSFLNLERFIRSFNRIGFHSNHVFQSKSKYNI